MVLEKNVPFPGTYFRYSQKLHRLGYEGKRFSIYWAFNIIRKSLNISSSKDLSIS